MPDLECSHNHDNLYRRLCSAIKRPLLRLWRSRYMPETLRSLALYLINMKYIVGVLAIVTDEDGRVLLFRHTYYSENPWGLPGGAAKHEDMEEALRREMREECHQEISIHHNIGIVQWDRRKIDFLFACSIADGKFTPSEEVAESDFFHLNALPGMRPHHKAMLAEIGVLTSSPVQLDTSIRGLYMSLADCVARYGTDHKSSKNVR